MYLKKRFTSLGPGYKIRGRPIIHGAGKIIAGKNLFMTNLAYTIEIFAQKDALIKIGDNVGINQGVLICACKKIEIGDSVLIGDQTIIYDTDCHGIDGAPPKIGSVKIGNHVWIGARAIILKGVKIGDNAIIGAGSIVTHNVEENSIMAGNPAKKVGVTSGYTFER